MDWAGKNVFITGADGFIGGWIAKTLVERGANVVVVVRDPRPSSALTLHNIKDKVTIVYGDICDYKLMRRIFNEYEIEYCFHLAAQPLVQLANNSPLSTFETNIKGTWTILEALRNVAPKNFKAMVIASTDKAYGTHEQLPYTEESELRGIYPYDASKVCADVIARCYATMYKMPIAVTRKANIYGGGDMNFSRLVPDTIRSLITGKELIIRSDGSPQRDFLYIEDAVDGYLTLAEHIDRVKGEAFNFSSGEPISVLDLMKAIIRVYGKEVIPKILGDARGEIDVQYLANQKAANVLGWHPKHTLDQGIAKSIAWYKNHFGMNNEPSRY